MIVDKNVKRSFVRRDLNEVVSDAGRCVRDNMIELRIGKSAVSIFIQIPFWNKIKKHH